MRAPPPTPSTHRVLLVAFAVALSVPPVAVAQRCTVDRSPDHDDWHEDYRDRMDLRDEIEAILRDAGAEEPTGRVELEADTATGRVEVNLEGVDISQRAQFRIRGALAGWVEGKPLSEWDVTVDLDRRRIPLWPDSTRQCEPVAVNDSVVRAFLYEVVATHPHLGRAAFLSVPKRARLWLFVEADGRVGKVEVQEPSGDEWFDENLEAIGRLMRFRPATKNGVPLGVWVTRRITFSGG